MYYRIFSKITWLLLFFICIRLTIWTYNWNNFPSNPYRCLQGGGFQVVLGQGMGLFVVFFLSPTFLPSAALIKGASAEPLCVSFNNSWYLRVHYSASQSYFISISTTILYFNNLYEKVGSVEEHPLMTSYHFTEYYHKYLLLCIYFLWGTPYWSRKSELKDRLFTKPKFVFEPAYVLHSRICFLLQLIQIYIRRV